MVWVSCLDFIINLVSPKTCSNKKCKNNVVVVKNVVVKNVVISRMKILQFEPCCLKIALCTEFSWGITWCPGIGEIVTGSSNINIYIYIYTELHRRIDERTGLDVSSTNWSRDDKNQWINTKKGNKFLCCNA